MSKCMDGIAVNFEKAGRSHWGKEDQKFPFRHIKCELSVRHCGRKDNELKVRYTSLYRVQGKGPGWRYQFGNRYICKW